MTPEGKQDRLERAQAYARRADPVMAVLAMIFLVVFTAFVVLQTMPPWLRVTCVVIQGLIWAAFVVDLSVRVTYADRRLRWLLTHPLDVLAVLWPAFRPLKVLAVISDRRFRGGAAVVRTSQAVVVAGVLLIWVCSVAVLAAERGQMDSTIETFGDALWWAFVTIATVGYGDMVPVTPAGRAIGIVLMVVGLALVAVITASVASWFVSHSQDDADDNAASRDADHVARIVELEGKIDKLLALHEEREGQLPPRG